MNEPSESKSTEHDPGSVPARAYPPGEAAGQVIDNYELLEELGEGGMGTVWMARQSAPVQRRVALKIIKLGMDTREVVARFEVERQALALMDHPYIAKVLDAGVTDAGRPYFVMELVSGLSITTYCDDANLGLRARLELFVKVCQAIQHAHQKGIIHRDLKPSNILVSEQDDTPVPKVIDFGVAKATGANLTQKTLHTQFGQIVGTPEYMAPEQAERNGLDIDTRADVYALGVLLYELLTGTKPFDLAEVLAAGFEELLRTIREDDPDTPSTRISSLGASASSLALQRQVDTRISNKRLRGDLDWIVMKALEKDRDRRYETAAGFAADIENYLHDEPVEAAPPSTSYRLRKLLRRRKKTVVSVATIGVLLIAGSVGTGIGWWKTKEANKSLDIALGEKAAALAEEEQQRLLAEENEERARSAEAQALAEAERATRAEASTQARADELEQVAAFQSEQLADLDVERMGSRLRAALIDAAPAEEQAEWSERLARVNFTSLALGSLRDNLFERTVAAIDAQFAEQPVVRANLLQTTANTMSTLGLLEMALDPQQRSVGLFRTTLGDEDPKTLSAINDMGFLLKARGELSEAEACFREALEGKVRVLGYDDPGTLTALNNMGFLLQARGKLAEAESYYREALEGARRVLGDEDSLTLKSLGNLGVLFHILGKRADAELYCREALEGRRRVLGFDHPETLTSASTVGTVLHLQGKLSEAEPYYREALEGRRRVLGAEHPRTLSAISNMGSLLRDQGRLSEAEPYYREAFEGSRVLGDQHPQRLTCISNMGALLFTQGRHAEATPYLIEALEGRRRALGDEHPETLESINNTGSLLRAQGKFSEAEPYYREAVEGARRVLGDEHSLTQLATRNLQSVLGKQVEAARESGVGLRTGDALLSLGRFQLHQGLFREAESSLTEALDLFFAEAPEGDRRPWQAQANLGAAFAGQGRYGDAEPVLLEAARGLLEAAESTEPARLAATGQVLQQVGEFYAAWHATRPGEGYDERSAEWRAKLAAWRGDSRTPTTRRDS